MIIELVTGVLIGLGLGLITGLMPGLHPNTIIPIIILIGGLFDPLVLAAMIVSIAITANFFEFIKSVYLSVPDEGCALAPSHELLMNGRGQEAIELMSKGALGSMLIAGSIIIPLSALLKWLYPLVKPYIAIVLVLISLHFILREKRKIGWALIIFLLSGVLGLVLLTNDIVNDPLMCMFTGFFGASFLIQNIGKNLKLPNQLRRLVVEIDRKSLLKGFLKGVMASSIITFIPAIGPAQSSLLASETSKKKDEKEYLVTIGGVNTCDVVFSLTALFVINKSRSGVIEIIKQTQSMDLAKFLILVLIAVSVSLLVYKLTLIASKIISKRISNINYSKYSLVALGLITTLVLALNGLIGLFIFALSTIIGLITNKKKVNRSHMLGSLVLPTLTYYF